MDNSQLNQFVFDFGYGLMNEEIMNMVVAKFIERYGVLGGAKETERWELACKVMKEAQYFPQSIYITHCFMILFIDIYTQDTM